MRQALGFGVSILHSWIRFFEYFLHISYRLDIQKWQARSEEGKLSVKMRKKVIQAKFRAHMGLLIDMPKQGGSGNTNDGNTARRFFQQPSMSAGITDIDECLIQRSAVILQALSSGFDIDPVAFDAYAMVTARLCVSKYPWYPMPSSVQKVLVHGSTIISKALLPIGQLSEEAQ